MASLIDKLINMTLGGTIKSVTNFGLKTSAKALTPTRLRSIGVAAGIYYGGNYLLTKARQDMSADYGSDVYTERYEKGENLARGVIGGAAISKAVLGGIFGKSVPRTAANMVAGASKGIASVFTGRQAPMNRLIDQRKWASPTQYRYERYSSYLQNKKAKLKSLKSKGNSWAASAGRKTAITGASLLGVGVGYYSTSRNPVALESRSVDVFGGSSSSKMNFNTAGLVQAMHDKRKRLA